VLTSTPTPTAYGMIGSPLEPYMLSDRQEQTLLKAHDLLARQCLRGFGIATNRPVLPLVGVNRGIRERNSRTFVDLEDAQRYGYHRSAAFLGQTPSPGPSAGPTGLSPEAEVLLDGRRVAGGAAVKTYNGRTVPADGCRGEAKARLAQGLALPAKLKESGSAGVRAAQEHVAGLRKQAIGQLVKDGRYQDVMKRWSACMKQAGHAYPNPRSAMRDKRWQTPEPTRAEINTAVADNRCRLEANYLGIIGSHRAAYEERMVQRDREVLRETRAYLRGVVRNAAKVIGERPLD
jgi:hypothetical protein